MDRAAVAPLGGSSAATAWKPAVAAVWASTQDGLFATKTFAAALLAFWIALRVGLERPYWAVTTCFIVAQPLAGAVLSKALFRLIGTFLGAAVAVLEVPVLVNAPELLTLALALWLGLCTYVSVLDRSPRAYLFLLAGYTAGIVAFPAVNDPGSIFDVAALRVQEIAIGILSSALVHGLLAQRSVSATLRGQAEAMILDARRLSLRLLEPSGESPDLRPHSRLIRDLGVLDGLITHLPFDMIRRPVREEMLRALQHQLMHVLALSGAVADRIARAGAAMPADVVALLASVRAWLEQEESDPETILSAVRRAEPVADAPWQIEPALTLNLLDRLTALVVAHHRCHVLQAALDSGRIDASVRKLLRSEVHRGSHRHPDHVAALRAAAATALTVIVCCVLWIGSAWPDGASAVVLASIMCALFSNLDDPVANGRAALAGVLIGCATAFVYDFAILPRITEFPVLVAALAPAFLLLGVILSLPGRGPLAIGLILVLPGLLMLGRTYDGNFSAFANSAVAQVMGALMALIMLKLVRGVGADSRRKALVRSSRKAVDLRFTERRSTDNAIWIPRMLDRVGLLSTIAGAEEEERAVEVIAMLRRLRLGMVTGELRRLQGRVTTKDAVLIEQLLRRGRAVSGASDGRPTQARLSVTVRLALRRLCRDGNAGDRREALVAVIGMWCNLSGPIEIPSAEDCTDRADGL
jgi:uncharacterized membrane protein YccC